MSESNRRPRVPVAGIGASAGGIHALQELFSALPDKLGIAIVVIVHLHPEHESDLAGILASRTALRVVQVRERMPLTIDTVYVIPPNRRLLITENDIASAPFDEPRGHRAPVDLFFRSLAEQHGDGFAIVLSGGGSDGAVGVSAVREQGGLILVQDPDEAEFSSMPRSAIANGADFILPVRELAAKLVELIRIKTSGLSKVLSESDESVLGRILAHVRSRKGQDFSKYKRPTVMRRLGRRMQVAQVQTLASYFAFLKDNPLEVDALFDDLLISVTSFFRDDAAFTALASKVIANLVTSGPAEQTIRVWVPGCATGEEAYSIAILLLEEAARRETRPTIQVFASDLDAGALAIAREGRYPTAIAADVSEERLARFFTPDGNRYRIRSEVRDLMVFATHSLLRDPPFTRMDLVSCRNLLIYLDRELQQQVITTFNYSLVPGGYLFLGSSETADTAVGLFRSVDRDARIFQVSDRPREKLPPMSGALTGLRLPTTDISTPTRTGAVTDAVVHRQALEEWAPPSILVNESQRILNLSETAGRYVLHPSGPLTNDAAEVVRPELKQELRAALFRVFQHNEPTVTLPIPVQFNGTQQLVVLHVRPVAREAGQHTALVLFVEGGKASGITVSPQSDAVSSATVTSLRDELQAARALLSTTREQYDAAIEELRAANEELQSINEEYRSTSEELETSKEELQSINEELQTLNQELKLKLDLVTSAHNDIQNLMSATDIGTLFLDRAMRIRRFTPRITELFSIRSGDEGRPITNFSHSLDYNELVVDAQKILTDLVPVERLIRSADGRWYTTRLRPYLTLDDKIDGVVVTFFDVTKRRNADAAWAAHQKVLLGELTHRVKNTLSVVQAVMRITLNDKNVSAAVITDLEARLQSLAHSHDLLVQSEWRGVSLDALARQQLAPYLSGNVDRLALTGSAVILPPVLATPLGLILHELSTNAAKHGALSVAAGRVSLEWQTRDAPDGGRSLDLRWIERGGPAVSKPRRRGTGSSLIENSLPGARVERKFLPAGLECSIEVPLILRPDDPLIKEAPRTDI